MSESSLFEVHNVLQDKLLSLYHEQWDLKGALKRIKSQQAAVREAIIKLDHEPETPKKKKRKKLRPTIGFVTMIAEILLRRGTLPKEYLKEEIKPLLTSRGFNFKGYSEVFRETMSCPQFRHDEHGNVTHVEKVCDDPLMGLDCLREVEVGNDNSP